MANQIVASSQITPTTKPHAATILSSQVTLLTYFQLQSIAHVTHVGLSLLFSFDVQHELSSKARQEKARTLFQHLVVALILLLALTVTMHH